MSDRRSRVLAVAATLLGGAAVVAVFAAAGPSEVLGEFASTEPGSLGPLIAAAAGWHLAWGLMLYVVLSGLGVAASPGRALAVYAAVFFANNVMPFAQAGAGPLAALFVSRGARTSYETGLAAVAAIYALTFLPTSAFVLLGAASLVFGAALGPTAELALVGSLGVVALALVGGVVCWRARKRLAAVAAAWIVAVRDAVSGVVPRVRPSNPAAVEAAVGGFLGDVERLADDPRLLAVGLSLSTAGWALLSATLWAALANVGHPVAPTVPLMVVPLAAVARAVPSPGGAGGVEAATVGLLVALADVPFAAATAATLLYRGVTYLLPLVVGAVAAATVGGLVRRSDAAK